MKHRYYVLIISKILNIPIQRCFYNIFKKFILKNEKNIITEKIT